MIQDWYYSGNPSYCVSWWYGLDHVASQCYTCKELFKNDLSTILNKSGPYTTCTFSKEDEKGTSVTYRNVKTIWEEIEGIGGMEEWNCHTILSRQIAITHDHDSKKPQASYRRKPVKALSSDKYMSICQGHTGTIMCSTAEKKRPVVFFSLSLGMTY